MNIEKISEQLLRDEGEILHAYPDANGYLTIGVGHLIDKKKGGSIPQEVSRHLLALDIQKAACDLSQALPWTDSLDEVRQAVLIEMSFNLGIGGLLEFKQTLALVHDGKYPEAAIQMGLSLWARQVGIRADRLTKQMALGTWQ